MTLAELLDLLARDRTVDITTTGRRSGRPHRIEIWTWIADGTVYLTGSPGRRDWYANLKANPELVLHVKRETHVDLQARARPIEDMEERRAVLPDLLRGRYDLETWVARAPLAQLEFTTLES
ncbi:MAG TPA: nitroreductase family deazaflavin-dependent oxidoreductase [Gaiellaceae bacterium]|nr:nitroreductase family deazaflavin-dependent oxidoreductase [Gaiellaceae bacterium]